MSTSLRSQLVRLAHAHPEFQADLLPLIFKDAGEVPEAFKKQWKNKGKDKDDDKDGDDKKGDDKKDSKPPWLDKKGMGAMWPDAAYFYFVGGGTSLIFDVRGDMIGATNNLRHPRLKELDDVTRRGDITLNL